MAQRQATDGTDVLKADAPQIPDISNYMDFRKYLADFYSYKKIKSKGALRPYSYAMFSAAANIKSPNYLKMIIEGKRNISDDMISKFAKALNLSRDNQDEFRLLVNFSQATDPGERNTFLKGLSDHRVSNKLKSGEIDRKTWEKVPNWVAWIIYAMVDQEGVAFNTEEIKSLLRGKASDEEIETALNGLIKFGELARDQKSGEIKKTHSLIESPEDVPVALVRKLQTQLMYLGLESIYQDPPAEREFGTLTMCLDKSEFEEIKFKLRQMRKSLHKDNSIARNSKKGNRVYQLNIQLFPVTDPTASKAEDSRVGAFGRKNSAGLSPEKFSLNSHGFEDSCSTDTKTKTITRDSSKLTELKGSANSSLVNEELSHLSRAAADSALGLSAATSCLSASASPSGSSSSTCSTGSDPSAASADSSPVPVNSAVSNSAVGPATSGSSNSSHINNHNSVNSQNVNTLVQEAHDALKQWT